MQIRGGRPPLPGTAPVPCVALPSSHDTASETHSLSPTERLLHRSWAQRWAREACPPGGGALRAPRLSSARRAKPPPFQLMGRSRRRRRVPGAEGVYEHASVAFPVRDLSLRPPFKDDDGVPHPCAPSLRISAAEHHMLGNVVPLDVWLARTAQGRGATVCVCVQLSDLTELVPGVAPAFQVRRCARRVSDDSAC